MRLFNARIIFIFLAVLCLFACKRDLVGPVDNQTKLSQKEIEIKWAEARSGRWFNYSHYHALKQSEKETIDTLRYMDALYSYTKNAQLYYRKMLLSKKNNIVNVDRYLDSIYPIIYGEMDKKMANPKYMEELFSEYTNLEVVPIPKDKSILKLSMLIDPVTVTRCEIPQVAKDFSYHLEHFEDGGGSAFFGADLCVFEAQEDLRRLKGMIYNNSASCASIEMQLQMSYHNFKMCIERQLAYMNIGGNYWDIFPPGHGGGGASGQSNNTLTKQPSKDPCAGRGAINERLKLTEIVSRNSNLLTVGSNEYGYESILDILTKSLSNNEFTTDALPTKINLSTNWTNNTITVGYTHNHPQDNAHSPSDLFFGVGQYPNMPAGHKQVFADYFTSTIITSENTYVVTIKDVDKWLAYGQAGLADEYAGYNKNVKDLERGLWENHTAYRPDSRLVVLLELFGDAINIYRKDSNGDFVPVSLNSGALVNPC